MTTITTRRARHSNKMDGVNRKDARIFGCVYRASRSAPLLDLRTSTVDLGMLTWKSEQKIFQRNRPYVYTRRWMSRFVRKTRRRAAGTFQVENGVTPFFLESGYNSFFVAAAAGAAAAATDPAAAAAATATAGLFNCDSVYLSLL